MHREKSDDKPVAYLYDIICNSAIMKDQLDNSHFEVIDISSDDQSL
ncbi:MAG TPA: hypothetical protein PLM20_08705 [Syntrophomonadaceae bacterium]|nr:hypothetical protein [Syntrophomonadaceae bacterium]HQE23966.1 hypothetical protein [Syntrophomonadaceae bacterium]